MRKYKTVLALLLLVGELKYSNGQTVRRCGTMEHHEWLMQTNNRYAKSFLHNESQILHKLSNPETRTSTTPDTIPVVVHVVWKTNAQNISDAQINSQIDVLNEDFGRTNADSVNTPAVWQSIAGSMPYRYVLARRDPNGNFTNGIVRVQTTDNSFGTDDQIKFDSQGGSDAWDVTTYLNIWVGNLGGGLLGYGEFPTGSPSNTYGFVCHYQAFGRVGVVVAPYNLGRTTTHELSHCFNLYHIWGDDGGACSGSDQVGDTPNQADATFGCYTFPHTDACSPASPGIMFMNYMDYSDDNCLNMFTQGQTTRMTTALNTFYPTIINSVGLIPGVLLANNAAVQNIISPTGTICDTVITPVVIINNLGYDTLHSVIINYQLDAGVINTYQWSGTLVQNDTAHIAVPAISVSGGSHTITSFTTLPNGIIDSSSVGDTAVAAFTVNNTSVLFPLTEGFQNTAFPPSTWSYTIVNNTNKWQRKTGAGGFGASSACAKMDNFSGSSSIAGQIDDLIAPLIDISSVSGSVFLTFSVAYAQYNSSSIDSLDIIAQAGCNGNAVRVYTKGGNSLETTTPLTSAFTPSASQWRSDTVDLSSFIGQSYLKLTFRSVSDWGNNLYIDDIGFSIPTTVPQVKTDPSLLVYPNPATDEVIVKSNFTMRKEQIQITNCLGQIEKVNLYATNNELILNTSELVNGIYIIRIAEQDKIFVKKLTINR